MTTQSQIDAMAVRPSVMQRLTGAFIAGRYRMAVHSMALEAPQALAHVIANPSADLDSGFAAEIERLLATGGAPYMRFDQTLLPLMQARFGVGKEQLATMNAAELKQLGKTCNNCKVTAQCWRALRNGESAEACSEFCPNAETFERLVLAQTS
jgi:hypothetical protein